MKNAIITGASSGIGKALAKNLAEQGYNLALISNNKNDLNAVTDALQTDSQNITIKPYALDVFDCDSLGEAISDFRKDFSTLDVLVNNAGVLEFGSAEIDPDTFKYMVNTNLIGFYNVLHCCVPIIKQQKSGYIINMSSMSGTYGVKGLGGYCSTKHAVVGFSASLYKELVPLGIRVTYLCPGVVDTPLTTSFPFKKEDKIPTLEICKSVNYLLSLHHTVAIEKLEIPSAITVNPTNLQTLSQEATK